MKFRSTFFFVLLKKLFKVRMYASKMVERERRGKQAFLSFNNLTNFCKYKFNLCRALSFVGLFLIAVGTGGIKPCVASFGGEQFKLPEQQVS